MNISIGSAPDSWGVWFPDDPKQVPWQRFLDELARAGYEWTELGPFGYLPTDPAELRGELTVRGLHLSGGTVTGPLHDPVRYQNTEQEALRIAELAAELDAKFLVVIPDFYRDLTNGRQLAPSTLDAKGWQNLIEGANRLGHLLKERFDMTFAFHPHPDTHVEYVNQIESFIRDTDPEAVSICLDTGHVAYRGGDPVQLVESYHDRIPYLHLKSVDPAVQAEVQEKDLPFATAVGMGVMSEPAVGIVDVPRLARVLREIDYNGWIIVEQDMYPCDPDKPFPIAQRTRAYLKSIGLG